MQQNINLSGYSKNPGSGRQPIVNHKQARVKESYYNYMTRSLLDNNRTIIDWHSESAENKDCREAQGKGFYDKLVQKFLCNFSTFKSTD